MCTPPTDSVLTPHSYIARMGDPCRHTAPTVTRAISASASVAANSIIAELPVRHNATKASWARRRALTSSTTFCSVAAIAQAVVARQVAVVVVEQLEVVHVHHQQPEGRTPQRIASPHWWSSRRSM